MVTKSSKRWLKEHFSDHYVKSAQQSGYRSRAAFKLLEINQRDHLLKPGMIIVDLGAAPGGWSQVAATLVRPKGKVIAVDLLPMESIENVLFMQQDFTVDETVNQLLMVLNDDEVDWVLSDMSPNISGNASVDIPHSIELAELTIDFAQKVLKKEGGVLIKVFQGEGFDQLVLAMKKLFKSVLIRKPKASRDRSREVYLLAKGMK